MTLAPDSPITGDCMLVVLNWVGDCFFGSEALRRGVGTAVTAPFRCLTQTGSGAALGGNVLKDIFTAASVNAFVESSGVPLDEEQHGVLEAINGSDKAGHVVSALAGAGKTALAHCVITCFVRACSGANPRRLVLYTVPTRTLRDEVVAEIIKFKAGAS